ncbi:MAG TPA: hypothetical protein VGS22_29315 [Thermoanaerobaculia bacterium]|jgi:tetratricopeptide (TPR) repeat protein|nr:hypothetical protein [Thermoanaerobaculia bacterium]
MQYQWHPTEDDLEALLAQSAPEASEVLRHLLNGCDKCREVIAASQPVIEPKEVPEQSYEEIFEKLELPAGPMPRDPEAGEKAWRLLDLPPGQADLLLRNHAGYSSYDVFEALLNHGIQLVTEWPGRGLTACELATRAAVLMKAPRVLRYDAIIAAHLEVANAHRLLGNFEAAFASLDAAEVLVEEECYSGDPLLLARAASVEASLAAYVGRPRESAAACRRGRALYRGVRDTAGEARILIQEASLRGFGEPEQALELLSQAKLLLPTNHGLRLHLFHNEAWFLASLGRWQDAERTFQVTKRLYPPRPHSGLLRVWLQAHILRAAGLLEESRTQLRKAEAGFRGTDLRHSLALLLVDVIDVEARLGNWDEVGTLALDLAELFTAWGVHAETIQRWLALTSDLAEHVHRAEQVRAFVVHLHSSSRRGFIAPAS